MQEEELDCLRAVYGDDNVTSRRSGTTNNLLQITIRVVDAGLCFQCELPSDYPAQSAPRVLNGGFAEQDLNQLFVCGEPVILAWIEHVRDCKRGGSDVSLPLPPQQALPPPPPPPPPAPAAPVLFVSSALVTANKSKFQGHAAHCRTAQECLDFVSYISHVHQKATHNMWAYRLAAGQEDNSDDGEDGAGKRLSLVLHSAQRTNVAVVVTRWYGGIQLGPARFKYIMQACRDAVESL